VPKSYISVKPVQKPHPPIYMAAFAPKALQRVATMADGWNPVAIPIEGMVQMFGTVKDMAKQAGRDPFKLEMIVRANVEITAKPLTNGRAIFQGTPEQIQEDVKQCAKIGAHELIFDVTFQENSLAGWLKMLETCRGWV
jgi:alkanesulfonate monooxygenase SsuD/methylene tetrahydromethanopterin reductase-like flavin-dependent oxidoreductase (luciferase family)